MRPSRTRRPLPIRQPEAIPEDGTRLATGRGGAVQIEAEGERRQLVALGEDPAFVRRERQILEAGRAHVSGIAIPIIAEQLQLSNGATGRLIREYQRRSYNDFKSKSVRQYVVHRWQFTEESTRIAMGIARNNRKRDQDRLLGVETARRAQSEFDKLLKAAGYFAQGNVIPAVDDEGQDQGVAAAREMGEVLDSLFGIDTSGQEVIDVPEPEDAEAEHAGVD